MIKYTTAVMNAPIRLVISMALTLYSQHLQIHASLWFGLLILFVAHAEFTQASRCGGT